MKQETHFSIFLFIILFVFSIFILHFIFFAVFFMFLIIILSSFFFISSSCSSSSPSPPLHSGILSCTRRLVYTQNLCTPWYLHIFFIFSFPTLTFRNPVLYQETRVHPEPHRVLRGTSTSSSSSPSPPLHSGILSCTRRLVYTQNLTVYSVVPPHLLHLLLPHPSFRNPVLYQETRVHPEPHRVLRGTSTSDVTIHQVVLYYIKLDFQAI